MFAITRYPRTAALLAYAGTLATACSESTAPASTDTPQFGSTLTLPQFQSGLGEATRVEIRLLPGGLTAREIELEPDDAEEQIGSRVTAISTASGTVTLELGGLVISYGTGARFRTPQHSNVTRSAWESQVESAVAAGQLPTIEVRRNPPTAPQAPSNPTFVALDLRLMDKPDEPKIEAYVNSSNLEAVAAPPPEAILRVFNLAIAVTSATRIQSVAPPGTVPTGSIEFEARVIAVDAAAGTLTLAGGAIVRVADVPFDSDGDIFTLASAASAVAAGKFVRAEGRGTVQSVGPPPVITATAVKVEIDD